MWDVNNISLYGDGFYSFVKRNINDIAMDDNGI